MLIGLLVAIIVVLLVAGMPIAAAFGLASAVYLFLSPTLPPLLLAKTMVEGIDSFTLLAIPFFVLAGNIMSESGIVRHIFKFARALVGHLPGGLGQVNILSSLIFAGMSGSAIADAGGLGAMQAREMVRNGYDEEFSAGVTSSSSTIGPIIPPSIPMLVYAVIASVSVKDLFLAGVVPGLMMATGLMLISLLYAIRRGYPVEHGFSLGNVVRQGLPALPALFTPILLVGGITLGIVTPTESAILAIGYALLISVLFYRDLPLSRLGPILISTAETTATVMIILATSATFAWILANEGVPQKAALILGSWTSDPVSFSLLIFACLLIVGTFMEAGAAMVILVPIFLPVADSLGLDRVHLGVIVVFTLMLGLITPPVGLVLFVLSKAAEIEVTKVIKGTMQFIGLLMLVGILVAVFPQLSMTVPSLVP